MYIFCDIDLYTRQHDIWNQISYETKEKCLHKSSSKIEWWILRNMIRLTSAYNVSSNNIGEEIWLYTSKIYIKHQNGKRHTNMDIDMV